MRRKVTNAMNRKLTKPVLEIEVKRAIFSIQAFSAPSDDGFNAKFYWEIIKKDVVKSVRSFFVSGRLLKSFNHTQICLIPKIKNASSMNHVRPISLCSVFYKIISKKLVHRL